MPLLSYNCVLCDRGATETANNLFIQCPFAKECWDLLGLSVPFNYTLMQALESFKTNLHVPFFMKLSSLWLGAFGLLGITSSSEELTRR